MDEREIGRIGRSMDEGRGAGDLSAAGSSYRAADHRRHARNALVHRPHAMGKLQPQGEIRLHWRLVQLPPRIAEYVVAHEVAHLVELNHSAAVLGDLDTLLPGHDDAPSASWTRLRPCWADVSCASACSKTATDRPPSPPVSCSNCRERDCQLPPVLRVSPAAAIRAEVESAGLVRRPRSRGWERGG